MLGLARKETSGPGLGGMISKLTFARLATRMGIRVVIFGMRSPEGMLRAVRGETGTTCLPMDSTLSARNKWLASGSLVSGRVVVDAGAYAALQQRRSLLAVGVSRIDHPFERGEIIELVEQEGMPFAVARARMSAAQLTERLHTHGQELAHADDIVLL
ncbi:MAG: hypothetical protein OHK0039_40240 [Bacteroidia bacterium]